MPVTSPAIPANFDIDHVESLQQALNEKTRVSPALKIDGNFGPVSIAALKAFQSQNHLAVTGIYDASTQAVMEPFLASKYLTLPDFQRAATALSVAVPLVKTVCRVESSESGFFPDGSCAILFERHQFYHYLSQVKNATQMKEYLTAYPTICNPEPGGYLGGEAEWTRYNLAATIDQGCANLATSWGLFQIMGFNFAACGYANAASYVADMKASEGKQLDAFTKFISTDHGGRTLQALRTQDWATFASNYNGPANVAVYSQKLRDAYASYQGALSS